MSLKRTPLARALHVSLVALALTALTSAPATGRDLGGRVALGVERSLGGATGLAFRYFLNEAVGLSGTLGVDFTLVEDEAGEGSLATGFVGSFGLAVHLARSLHAHFGFGLRATLGWRSLEAARLIDPASTTTDVHLAIEVPLLLEFFLSDHFSVGVATGVLLNFVPASGSTLPTTGHGGGRTANTVGIGIGAGSVSTLAILYYF